MLDNRSTDFIVIFDITELTVKAFKSIILSPFGALITQIRGFSQTVIKSSFVKLKPNLNKGRGALRCNNCPIFFAKFQNAVIEK